MAKRSRIDNELIAQLGKTSTPLFVVDLERRVQVFNAGCEALTGWSAADVIGQAGHYASPPGSPGVVALASSVCPPPEAFQGQSLCAPARLAHQAGHVVPCWLHFFPLYNDAGVLTGVLGVAASSEPAPPMRATAAHAVHAELAALRAALRARFSPEAFVAASPGMTQVLNQIELAQHSPACVLLEGEPGTGKEHLARVIHFGSPARANWFVPLDCRRLGAEELTRVWNRLLELHAPPAYSAASPQPGSVYLADVEFLPRDLQARLAEVFGAGDAEQRPRIRLIAGTGYDLRAAVECDRMRADFVAIVSTLTIALPNLSRRGDDILLLAQHFLEEANRQSDKQVGGFDEATTGLFLHYPWPGNLDELALVVRQAFDRAEGALITPADLPFRFRTAYDALAVPPPVESRPLLLEPLLTRVETQLIALALERCKYNKSQAAAMLGINRARLLRRIEQLQIADIKAAVHQPGDVDPGSPDQPPPA